MAETYAKLTSKRKYSALAMLNMDPDLAMEVLWLEKLTRLTLTN